MSPILGATSYQCLLHLANRCTVCPHWAPGATRLQHPLHLAIRTFCSPMSHRSHYMNHAKIYPFSDDLCPQWALGATSYQCLIHLAVRCTMCPHWALGATRLQRSFYLAISDVPGRLWAIGATTWTTSRSIHFRRLMSPMSPESPFIPMSYTSSRSMHYVSPLSPGSHEASMPFTLSNFGRSRSPVSHRSHYMNHVKIYPFQTFYVPNEP